MMLNPETGIYGDNPVWPLHILKPARMQEGSQMSGIFVQHCATSYAQPNTTDPDVFAAATDRGRLVCERCVAWLVEQGKLPASTG